MTVRLTAAQRDFLATYADGVEVEVRMVSTTEIAIRDVDGDPEAQIVPAEGQLMQPIVRLLDPEQALDELPETPDPLDG